MRNGLYTINGRFKHGRWNSQPAKLLSLAILVVERFRFQILTQNAETNENGESDGSISYGNSSKVTG